jgi:hypothetical protein
MDGEIEVKGKRKLVYSCLDFVNCNKDGELIVASFNVRNR